MDEFTESAELIKDNIKLLQTDSKILDHNLNKAADRKLHYMQVAEWNEKNAKVSLEWSQQFKAVADENWAKYHKYCERFDLFKQDKKQCDDKLWYYKLELLKIREKQAPWKHADVSILKPDSSHVVEAETRVNKKK